MNVALDKRLKKSLNVLENVGNSKTNSPKRNKDGFVEALNNIKKVLVDENYWSKAYGSRCVNCIFHFLDVDDASLRLQAEQCLNAIFRKCVLKSQPSRVLACLLNELSRNGSARGFAVSITMLVVVLKQAREHRLSVYAMHILHSLREALKRPEQTVQSAIENYSTDIIRFFKSDYTEDHLPYLNRLMVQCLENLSLTGAYNRASSDVLAALACNVSEMMELICARLLGLLSIVEERKHKNEIVGILNTLRKMWPSFDFIHQQYTIRSFIVKILGCLKSNSSEIESPLLELLHCIVVETSYDTLNFQPILFKIETPSGEDDDRKSISQFFEMDPLADLDDMTLSRSTSIGSLVESEYSRAASTVKSDNTDEADDLSNRSGNSTPTNQHPHQNYVEMDPLFQSDSPSVDYLLDRQFENESVINDESIKEVEGYLCSGFPSSFCPPNSDFYFYSSTLVAQKFLLTGKIGELHSGVRTSLKILALKYLASVGSIYEDLANVVVYDLENDYKQGISDLHQLLTNDDEGLLMTTFNLFANIENTSHQNGQKVPLNFYSTGRFLSLTNTILQNANPRRLKEVLQIFANNVELLMSDEHLFTTVIDSALGSIDCDYFLLKIARAELFSKIKWNCLNPNLIATYQSLCLNSFCRQCFDSDYRAVQATINSFQSLIKNAEFGFITDIFNVHWNESLYLPSFKPMSQVFALHSNYSFCGDSPDLALEENLTEVLEVLTKEYVSKPNKRCAGYINALLVLASSYPPSVYNSAWGCLNRSSQNQPYSLLGMLVEIADSSTTTLSQLTHILKLIGLIFSGSVETAFIKGANRAEFNQNIAYLEGEQMLDKLLIIYLRLLNLYYTIIKELTTPVPTVTTLTSPLFPRINWTTNTEHENSQSYYISNLTASGIRPYKMKTSFLNSPSLCLLESVIRGSFSNFMSSMKADIEERVVAPLEAALDGFGAVLEMLPSDILASFIDELFLYVRSMTNLAIRPVTNFLIQMLKVLFVKNAININANQIVSMKVRHTVPPTDYLEMLIGRSINNYSVHVAFLDRFEQIDLHKLRHIGWTNKSAISKETSKPEITSHLEQFEKSVTYLLQAYLNISHLETRCAILKMVCVLVLNDVRYDKLDPNNRVLNSVLSNIRHEKFKNGNSFDLLFTFLCIVARSVDNLSFDQIVDLVEKCVERVDCNNEKDVDNVLSAIHIVLIEAITFYSTMPKNLVKLLAFTKNSIFETSPAKTIELWNVILHWSRSTKTDLLWQQLSADFVDNVFAFVSSFDAKIYNFKIKWEMAHSMYVGFKICHPTVFRPVDQLYKNFLNVATKDLFLCIPFALTLLSRLDQETILLQLAELDQNAMQSIGRSLATVFLRETTKLLKITDSSQLNYLENGISFFGIMLVHILRSDNSSEAQLSSQINESFKSTILESNEFERLETSFAHIVHSRPKVFAVWSLVFFQLEIFNESDKTMFAPNLSFHGKQLIALLFLQRLCDKRLSINDEFLQLFNSISDEFAIRILKIGNSKQLEMINERLPSDEFKKFNEKIHSYLSTHPMVNLLESLFDLNNKSLMNKIGSNDLMSKCQLVQSWISTGIIKPLEKTHIKMKQIETFTDICFYLLQTIDSINDIACLTDLAVHLDTNSLKNIIETIDSNWRLAFLKSLFESLNKEIRQINNNAYLDCQNPNFTPVMEHYHGIVDLMNNSDCFDSSNFQQILLSFLELPYQIECFQNIKINSLDKILNICFIKELMEAEMENLEIGSDFYKALTELFHRGNLHELYANDYKAIENLCLVLRLILDNVEKINLPKTQRFKINRNHWKVELLSECAKAESLKDDILECFVLIQRAAHFLLQHSNCRLFESAKKAILSIVRLPVFSKMFVVPKMALNRDWKLEIIGQKDAVQVSLIQIHMLNDPEIISDFSRRILCLGWTSKLQFETWFVNLLGVLCSTPIGNDLNNEDVQKISDQINATSIAIETLTAMLLQSLLQPHAGDTVNSRFLLKNRQTRDSYLFLQSANGKHSAIGRTLIEYGLEPQSVFVQNIERDVFSRCFYSFGQTAISHLWSMVEERQGTVSPTKLNPTLKKASANNLDISSLLKALFENFFHWCTSDINKLPLPLLVSTVQSMALLSDLFSDVSLYSNVFNELKILLDRRQTICHPLYGYSIYTILKCLAILDWEKLCPNVNKSEVQRSIDEYVQAGLSSSSIFVVSATIHGILYLTQSPNLEDFSNIFSFVSNFVLEEVTRLNTKIDVLNVGDVESVAYHRLLFTVGFELVELPINNYDFANKFVPLVCSLFADPRLPTWQHSSLANGIQRLVMRNAAYCESFREIAVELFDTYQLRPLHLPHSLSVYIVCAYRMLKQSDKPINAKQAMIFQSDLQRLMNVFSFYTVRKYIHNFLPAIAHLMFSLLDKEQLFEMILSTVPINDKNAAKSLSDYDRCMSYLLYYILRIAFVSQQQDIIDFSLKRIFTRFLPMSKQSTIFKVYASILTMCALSPNSQTNLLVHVILRQKVTKLTLLRSSYLQARTSFKQSLETCGFNIDERDFPPELVFELEDGSSN